MRLAFRLNGAGVELDARPDESLLEVLRLQCDIQSARPACELGLCGACTVLVDGRPVCSCLYPAVHAEGCEVLTCEGLGTPDQLHPVQQAFLAENAFQCGYCTPGFELMAVALLREQPAPDEAAVRAYLSGNLCRCGSYEQILRAVRHAAEGMVPGAEPTG